MEEEKRDWYLTISGKSEGTYRDKASKFIANALPVFSEEEAKSALDRIRKNYYDANHHCYAYRIGYENFIYRIQDDGEPSGSAGKPIYGQILSKELYDVLVVVTRYFGGTKLGIPGLIHAYRTAAKEALEKAVIVESVMMKEYSVQFEYPLMNEVMRIIKESGCKIIGQTAGDQYEIRFQIRKRQVSFVESKMQRIRGVTLR
ncbi:MAG: YigZ family protein [Alphaproteobacteria bacterium]|nr:YigZ family protein [Alphaproteobacteria bacterium]